MDDKPRGHGGQILLQSQFEIFINLIKELNVDLLKRVDTAELVQLVVDLVEDERLVVVGCVVLHDIIHCMWDQEVHHLDPVEVDHHATACPTRYILHLICLECGLHRLI